MGQGKIGKEKMMEDIKKIKQILDTISPSIEEALIELNKIKETSIDSGLDRADFRDLRRACKIILECKEYIGLDEVERIMKSSVKAKPMSAKTKRALGFDGCFE